MGGARAALIGLIQIGRQTAIHLAELSSASGCLVKSLAEIFSARVLEVTDLPSRCGE
jgi:hypothetical protein